MRGLEELEVFWFIFAKMFLFVVKHRSEWSQQQGVLQNGPKIKTVKFSRYEERGQSDLLFPTQHLPHSQPFWAM